ncbi:MAG TPA: pitrilysin family protein [Hyphomicrobiaceae bacterium]|nr:pitrilysin family protein [Hyphomicrobiaceae bacterium]
MPRAGLLFALAIVLLFAPAALAEPRVNTFTLANGMQVVVIEDHRVPVVTHMVWYRAGAAEDPWGTSGIAHFLEHLMFKSTGKLKSGEFSRTITRLGGRDNATTTHDSTSYYQRVAKEHLRAVMELEADRMVNLRLVEEEVKTERDVILAERRSNIDGNPLSLLSEQMLAALYQNHPYGRPSIGFEHEMAKLSRQDALSFYKRYYAPNNAVLVVAGDVTPEEVKALAQATYGKNRPNRALVRPVRADEPKPIAARRVQLVDGRAGARILLRYYLTPSFASGPPGEGESLELLARIIGGDDTSRLYRRLVVEKLASTAGANFSSAGRDSGRLAFVIIPLEGVALEKVEAVLDAVILDVREKGVTQAELDRAKGAFEAVRVFESDDQGQLARRYGEGVAFGQSIADIDELAKRVQSRSLDDIKRVASEYLGLERSVTGTLVPPQKVEASAPQAVKQ